MQIDAPLNLLPGLKKNFKKSAKKRKKCLLSMVDSVLYVYMIKKKTLKERIEEAKKRNYLTLLQILDILITNKGEKHYV